MPGGFSIYQAADSLSERTKSAECQPGRLADQLQLICAIELKFSVTTCTSIITYWTTWAILI